MYYFAKGSGLNTKIKDMCKKHAVKNKDMCRKNIKKIRICDTIYSGGKAYEKKNV